MGPLNLTSLLAVTGHTLETLEEQISRHLGQSVCEGDIMLKHIEHEEINYPVWLICIEGKNGIHKNVRAYNTYEECLAVHQYRGLPSTALFRMADQYVLTGRQIQAIIDQLAVNSNLPANGAKGSMTSLIPGKKPKVGAH